jgi:hypothetical protein
MKAWKLEYEKAKQRAVSIYSNIGTIKCPALGGESVHFTRIGFSHLIRKGKNPRTRNEQKKRFFLVSYINQVLNNQQANIEYRKEQKTIVADRHGKKVSFISIAEFWTLAEKISDCTIKVVIRQLDTGGPKHFFSIMGNNVTLTNGKRNKKPRS